MGLFVRRLLCPLLVVVLCGRFLTSGFHCVCAIALLGTFVVYWKWLSYCSLWFLIQACVRSSCSVVSVV